MTASMLIDSVAQTTAHRDRDALDASIARLLLQFLDAESVSLYGFIDDGGIRRVLRRVHAQRGQAEQLAEDVDLARLPALDAVPAWNECVLQRQNASYSAFGGNSCQVFPIESERDVSGLLVVETTHGLQPRDMDLVSGILRIVKNHLALLDYGERDTLTGLKNRKTFEASFEKLRLRSRVMTDESSEPSWLGVVDIDKFKQINDTYGHLFGDEVLLLVSQLMMQSFRGADQLFRFGGEEFVVVLDRASVVGAEIAFNRLRTTIETHRFPQVEKVTVSLGYTRVDTQDAPSTCVERADAALYYAKHHGRNAVYNYERLVEAGELTEKRKSQDIELF